MAIGYPLLNGVRYDHSSLNIMLAGSSAFSLGIKSIDYSDGLEPGKVFGASAQKLAETRGQYDCEASLEMYRAEYDAFVRYLVNQNQGIGLYEIRWDINVNYLPEGGLGMVTDNIVSVRIKKPQHTSAAGSEPLAVKLDLSPMYIIKNGILPITNLRK